MTQPRLWRASAVPSTTLNASAGLYLGPQEFFAPCPRGLEALLVKELTGLSAASVEAVPGGVHFVADWRVCYRVNLWSRLATRVLWRVARCPYRTEDDIYAIARNLPWNEWFSVEQTIRVYVTAIRSPLKSLEFLALRTKDAVCDAFRAVLGKRPSVDTANPDMRIHLFLDDREAMLYLDTSGAPLYKRGLKRARVEAPLKENLAAGILMLANWKPEEPLFDPMCGSATFLLEAAQIALEIAPGLGRKFAFERFRRFDPPLWRWLVSDARAARRERDFRISGADVDAVEADRGRRNLQYASLDGRIKVVQADILTVNAPAESGVLVTNPPYGVRMGEQKSLDALYPKLGDALKQHFAGWRCYFFSGDENLPKLIGLKASKRTPLYNGALECRLYEYRVVSGKLKKTAPPGLSTESK
ncbi:MAG: class I SAM-dependent RNA methyltransferase [Sterolibacteriaceae bacterium]|uniref:Class I SAM-dependent RNA methyltransferase n=1 Tax=Candidatus Methylophosphatis roskildensis TaxID=2899263 RepID=A0A9D7HSM7_9PROT|nr:class I SAM-dependent RNA methyltransferase [Candidatus Methylophosphatis roskildensis]MBK7234914.1 class I SAM-dependent RNA methyltransferase [Sterolibacteriaceae bacterium]